MSEKDKSPKQVSNSETGVRRLRMAGIVVLASGIVASGIIYWLGTREPDLSGDISMQGFDRAERRQMGQLYGKSGLLAEEWADDLKEPGTQAVLLLIGSAAAAAGCFYFAYLLDGDEAGEGNSA